MSSMDSKTAKDKRKENQHNLLLLLQNIILGVTNLLW